MRSDPHQKLERTAQSSDAAQPARLSQVGLARPVRVLGVQAVREGYQT